MGNFHASALLPESGTTSVSSVSVPAELSLPSQPTPNSKDAPCDLPAIISHHRRPRNTQAR